MSSKDITPEALEEAKWALELHARALFSQRMKDLDAEETRRRENLHRLLMVLRGHGVTQYANEGVSISLACGCSAQGRPSGGHDSESKGDVVEDEAPQS